MVVKSDWRNIVRVVKKNVSERFPAKWLPVRRPERGDVNSPGRLSSSNGLEAKPETVDLDKHPNLRMLQRRSRNLDNMIQDIKVLGYELAQSAAEALPIRSDVAAQYVGLKSKPSTQSDLESDWAAYWSSQLKAPVVFDGRLWELSYILQAIHENGHICAGSRGLGFGYEQEPLPGYLAAADVNVAVADLRHGDMNGVADDQKSHDFCWSIRAMERFGSIEKGLDFVEDSLIALRPGGLAVHTTEFNFSDDNKTIDNLETVLFQRKHFEELAKRLRASGHVVAELDFNIDRKPLDRFIDLPPIGDEWPQGLRGQWAGDERHVKRAVGDFLATRFGLIVIKDPASLPTRATKGNPPDAALSGMEFLPVMSCGAAGELSESGVISKPELEGHMVYGPYVRLPEASYEAEFVIRACKGDEAGRNAKLAIEAVAGDRLLNRRDLEIYSPVANAHRLSFAVDREAALCNLEFRLWVRAGTYIELMSVRVTRK